MLLGLRSGCGDGDSKDVTDCDLSLLQESSMIIYI
jgi:hypothetical protein